jgi:hypothetical protein
MNIFRINTTAFVEEDFFLQTDLSEQQIVDIIYPIVLDERNENIEYNNDDLVSALQITYPDAIIEYFTEFETITI